MITALALLAVPAVVLANTGAVTASETCSGWSVTVSLDNNVQSNHLITVTSTISGYTVTGITFATYDTTASGKKVIWSPSGSNQVSGTVTLIIYNPPTNNGGNGSGGIENSYSATISPASGCKSSPAVSTTLVAPSPVAIGTTVHDTATIHGATSAAGGTITYKLYSNSSCSALVADLTPTNNTVTNGVAPASNGYQFNNAGTWYFQATYSGDSNNTGPVSSPCTSETLVVNPTPSPTPFQSFAGETATPSAGGTDMVEAATGTPVRVATPPVTNTDGSSPSGDSMPFFALLICLSFGGLGLLAVQAQRQSVRQ